MIAAKSGGISIRLLCGMHDRAAILDFYGHAGNKGHFPGVDSAKIGD
jgi:hypothetical protein